MHESYLVILSFIILDDRVQHLRDALSAKLNLTERNIVFREVTKHRISRELDDNVWLRFLNTTTRKVYCIEVFNLPTQSTGNLGDDRDEAGCSGLSSSSTSTSTSTSTGTLTESTVTGGDQEQFCHEYHLMNSTELMTFGSS